MPTKVSLHHIETGDSIDCHHEKNIAIESSTYKSMLYGLQCRSTARVAVTPGSPPGPSWRESQENNQIQSREPGMVELFNAMSENKVFTKTGCWFDLQQHKPPFLLPWAGVVENVSPGLFDCRSANP